MKPSAACRYLSFDIQSLGSRELMKLLIETSSYVQGIKIEMVHERGNSRSDEAHPAFIVGVDVHKPTIQFVDCLDREQRVEAIAHEFGHLILLYRFGLGLIIRRRPRRGDGEDVFRYFMNMNRDWFYLLSQIGNTTHHLFLIDYLKREYGIESKIHRRLLRHNLSTLANEECKDMESLYAKGIIAFEYDRLIGNVGGILNPDSQPELFWKAYASANGHFGGYRFPNIPTPSNHEANAFSFLEDLGYKREDFTFFP
jgi:hypothetical protein